METVHCVGDQARFISNLAGNLKSFVLFTIYWNIELQFFEACAENLMEKIPLYSIVNLMEGKTFLDWSCLKKWQNLAEIRWYFV